MRIGRVLGSVVATVAHPSYAGHKLLWVQPEDASGQSAGPGVLAIDTVQAGPGDRVLVLSEGKGARDILGDKAAPVRSVIVGIVDAVTFADGATAVSP